MNQSRRPRGLRSRQGTRWLAESAFVVRSRRGSRPARRCVSASRPALALYRSYCSQDFVARQQDAVAAARCWQRPRRPPGAPPAAASPESASSSRLRCALGGAQLAQHRRGLRVLNSGTYSTCTTAGSCRRTSNTRCGRSAQARPANRAPRSPAPAARRRDAAQRPARASTSSAEQFHFSGRSAAARRPQPAACCSANRSTRSRSSKGAIRPTGNRAVRRSRRNWASSSSTGGRSMAEWIKHEFVVGRVDGQLEGPAAVGGHVGFDSPAPRPARRVFCAFVAARMHDQHARHAVGAGEKAQAVGHVARTGKRLASA